MIPRRAAVAAAALLPAAALVGFFACGGSEFTTASAESDDSGAHDSASPVLDAGVADAHDASPAVDSASPGDSAMASPDTGVTVPDAAGVSVVYVSAATGSDSNSGFTPTSPKQTLVAAVAAAEALDGGVEVHACAGTYNETALSLTSSVSLRGAYDCTTWTRTATFGFPTFDGVNATHVGNASPASQAQTLVVQAGVSSATLIDGLEVVGAPALASTTTGILVRGNALLTDLIISGGGGRSPTTFGSLALQIAGAGAPEVRNCAINGGSGTGSTGSAGIYIDSSGQPFVHGNVVSGGHGTAVGNGTATWGIDIASSAVGANALTDNIVAACDSPGVEGFSVGVRVTGADASVDIVGSQILGCTGTGDGGTSFGIQVNAPGAAVRILEDRVFGGVRSGSSPFTAAIDVVSAGSIAIHNSELHAGEATGTSPAADGIEMGAVASPSIDDDTIYAGANAGTAVVLLAGSSGVHLTDTLLLSAGPGQARAAVFAQGCAGIVATLDHNVFVNQGGPLFTCNPQDGGPTATTTTLAGLYALFPSTTAFDDLEYAETTVCNGGEDGGCVASTACPGSTSACLGELLGTSFSADDGVTGLFSSPAPDGGAIVGGWTLAPGAPCAIARGGTPVSGIETDLYGATRNGTAPTIGATEVSGTASCTP
jgi:hypothetical protein